MEGISVQAHHFSDGLYCKEIILKDAAEVISHKHKYDHLSVLAKGTAVVTVDDEQTVYYSPAVINIKADTNHSVRAIGGDAVWMCIHATDESDETKVDKVLISDKL
jgi:quercetin dioxygenase-like cupin family protein